MKGLTSAIMYEVSIPLRMRYSYRRVPPSRAGTLDGVSERESSDAEREPAGESSLPAVDPDELADVGELQQRAVVAVRVNERLALELGRHPALRLPLEELAEQKRLRTQTLCVLVVREEVAELVPEDGDAARLEPDDRHPLGERRPKLVEYLPERAPRELQHAEVVQRSAAAERPLRDLDPESRR